ncbi:MAG: RecQ family zinc-binding domain-containing protein, partial [Chloroflexota bacterium]
LVTRNTLDIAELLQTPLNLIEDQLYAWEEAGLVEVTPNSRINLVTTLAPPSDTAERIERLLDQYHTQQKQRIAEIGDYGKTSFCRHGYLANYLGGLSRERCDRCDNCVRENLLPEGPDVSHIRAQAEAEIVKWSLIALIDGGWGRYNLVRLLQGELSENDRARYNEAFGTLSEQSERMIKLSLESMLKNGFISEKSLSHGGKALGITSSGRKKLHEIG